MIEESSSDTRGAEILWYAAMAGVVTLAIAMTYALARLVQTGWIFVE